MTVRGSRGRKITAAGVPVAAVSAVSAAVLVLAVLGLTGCGATKTDSAPTSASTENPALVAPTDPPDPLTLLKAGKTALAQVTGATLTFIESETDDTGTWKVRLTTADGAQQQLKVGVDGVSVLVPPAAVDADGNYEQQAQRQAAQQTLVNATHQDYRAAVQAVLAAVPDASITRLDLQDVDGKATWQAIAFDTDLAAHRVSIDAGSGALIADDKPR